MAKKTKVVSIVFIDPDSKPGVKSYLFMNTSLLPASGRISTRKLRSLERRRSRRTAKEHFLSFIFSFIFHLFFLSNTCRYLFTMCSINNQYCRKTIFLPYILQYYYYYVWYTYLKYPGNLLLGNLLSLLPGYVPVPKLNHLYYPNMY